VKQCPPDSKILWLRALAVDKLPAVFFCAWRGGRVAGMVNDHDAINRRVAALVNGDGRAVLAAVFVAADLRAGLL
jgi:hypothetical protein